MSEQITQHILMVRPVAFGFNEQTAASNAFQNNSKTMSAEEVKFRAIEEFDGMVARLRAKGVNVIVVRDTDIPVKPDAVFPNNWVTFHDDGTVITYPMYAPIRRLERQEGVMEQIFRYFDVKNRLHLETFEADEKFLEGTGSMVFDRPNKLIYACISPRTNLDVLDNLSKILGYEAITFDATDEKNQAIYHTNVMMALGETFAVICLDSIKNEAEKSKILQHLKATDKDIIEISFAQMNSFAGNMLQVQGDTGATYLVMSEQAFTSLTPEQVELIDEHTNILYIPIPTIETFGGGSARCMMSEIFLQERN